MSNWNTAIESAPVAAPVTVNSDVALARALDEAGAAGRIPPRDLDFARSLLRRLPALRWLHRAAAALR